MEKSKRRISPQRPFRTSVGNLAAVACAFMTVHAVAQIAPTAPPPVRTATDPNGVDLVNGLFESSAGILSIGGPGPAGLSYSVLATSRAKADGTPFGTAHTTDQFHTSHTIALGTSSETFTGTVTQGTFTGGNNVGSKLEFTGGHFVYTLRDGTVATFTQGGGAGSFPDGTEAKLASLVYPNGERLDYLYAQTNSSNINAGALSVTSNSGYQMKFEYTGTVLTKITMVNMAVDYCDPAAASCTGLTQTWPSVSTSFNGTNTWTAVDALSRTTVFTRNADGSSTFTLPSGRTLRVTWVFKDCVSSNPFSTQFVASVSDGTRTWNYDWATASDWCGFETRTATVTDATGHQRVVVSASSPQGTGRVLVSDRDELGGTTSYVYSSNHLTKVTYPEGNFDQYDYDARGNVIQKTRVAKPGSGFANIVTSANFDATCTNSKTCNQPNFTIDARGARTDYTYDPTHGGVLTVTGPAPSAGAVRPQTRYSYTAVFAWYKNSAGTLVQAPTPIYKVTGISVCQTGSSCTGTQDEVKTTLAYGVPGTANNLLPTARTEAAGDGSLSRTITTTYDTVGNTFSVDGPLAGTADTVRTRYDGVRQLIGTIGPDPDGGGPLKNRATRNTYSADGLVTRVERGTTNSQSDTDWAGMSVLDSTDISYDTTGRKTLESRAAGGITQAVKQYTYDAVGRLDCTTQRMNPALFGSLPPASCTPGAAGSYGPDRITRMFYDADSHLTKVQSAVATSIQRDEVTRTYTANGMIATVADGNGNLSTNEYDGFDRLSKLRFPSPTTAGVSSQTDFEQYTYDPNGNLLTKRRRNGQFIVYTPDALNRVSVKDLPSTTTDDLYFGYDNLGRLTSARFGSTSGDGTFNTYDALGRRSSTTTFGRTLSCLYDLADHRTRITHPDGYFAAYTYDTAGDLSGITDSSGTTLAAFTFNDRGQVTGLGRGSGASTGYGYDALGRLASVTQDLSGALFDNTLTFDYTPAAQLNSRTQTNDGPYLWTPAASSVVSLAPNGLNQVTQVGSTSVSYDALGNLITGAAAGDGTWTYGYDSENQLRSATSGSNTVSLNYDAAGLLYQTNSNGALTSFLYDGSDLVAEYDGAGTVLARYVHGSGPDQPLVWYQGVGTGSRRYLHADERGSVVAISNDSAIASDSFKYSPYGETTSALSSRFGYTGQAWIPAVGLYYYKARFYSPKLGRFLQTDPVGTQDDPNLYAYTSNDPINNTDPTGDVGELLWTARDEVKYTVRYTVVKQGANPGFTPQQVRAQVAKNFTGSVNINGVTVKVTAQAIPMSNPQGHALNTITVVPNTQGVTASGRSTTDSIGGSRITVGASGPEAATATTVSHELGGHAGGAGDQYKGGVDVNNNTLPADVPGAPNIMKDLTGADANEQTLREIVTAPTNTNTCVHDIHAANGKC